MLIDALASERHFLEHMAPIWRELGKLGLAGEFTVAPALRGRADELGVGPARTGLFLPAGSDLIMIAGIGDMKRVPGRPVVMLEHGAGQGFGNRHPSHPGGRKRERVTLFVCPNESVARRNLDAYPAARAAIVGCAKLDPWHARLESGRRTDPWPREPGRPVVAISFHWDGLMLPETRTAFYHFKPGLKALATDVRAMGGELIGHAHPRIWEQVARAYRPAGIEAVRDFDEVMGRADVYVADGMSTLYEFASTDRPVVVLNCPFYRKGISHGFRFWEYADVGPQVEGPGGLMAAIGLALEDREPQRERRLEIADAIYAPRDGRAAERAAAAIAEHLEAGTCGEEVRICGEDMPCALPAGHLEDHHPVAESVPA